MLQHELAMRLQHELAMTLQLLATQNIGSRPFTTALHFRRYKKKPATTEARKKTSVFRVGRHWTPVTSPPPDYTTVNNPHRELQNYSSSPINLLV
jgi:hypothetical protein